MSDDLLILARVRTLRDSLEKVKSVVSSISESRPVRRQLASDEELLALLKDVRRLSLGVRQLGIDASQIDVASTGLAETLDRTAVALTGRLAAIDREFSTPLDRRAVDMGAVANGISSGNLVTEADDILGQLDRVEAEAREAAAAAAAGEAEKANLAYRAAWKRLNKEGKRSGEIFQAYVDYLAGLAMREAGFDAGLCRLADEFVRDMEVEREWPWTSWTVPAQREVREATLARIIRLGFPEWSIWAIPLAAHEFAQMALANSRFTQLLPANASPETRVLLADAFATMVAGPAYACALFALRLEPPMDAGKEAGGRQRPPLDHARARITLLALEQLDDPAAGVQPTAGVRALLAGSWDEAITWIDPAPQLSADEEQRLVTLVTTLNSKIGRDALFPIRHWTTIEGWAGLLVDGRGDEIQPDNFTQEVRIMLNAAWAARVKADPDDLPKLAGAARSLVEAIVYGGEDAGGQGGAGEGASGANGSPSGLSKQPIFDRSGLKG